MIGAPWRSDRCAAAGEVIASRPKNGTAMPSFRRFSKAQLYGLADYVRLLSLRGMVERDLALTYTNNGALPA